ncbi:MAG: type IV secretion system DNA-binding domain-containing protein [Candidatus Gracilibacteria bacterium]
MDLMSKILSIDFWKSVPGDVWDWLIANPLIAVLYVVGFYVAWKTFWKLLRFWYALHRRKYLKYMKITLPREDSQKDKEQATEKDFKEKMGNMEQLFRGLHEIRELTLSNRIRVWLFDHAIVSFELFVEKKELSFYVVTDEYYADIVEKQVTSFYSSADIQVFDKPYTIESNDLKQSNSVMGYYLRQANKFWFPLKTYKTLENDPLNDLTNVMSKLEENEKAVIQIVVKPRSAKWQRKALNFGMEYYKGNVKKKGGGFLRHIPVLGYLNTILVSLVFGYDQVKKSEDQGGGAPGSPGSKFVRMLQTEEESAKRIGEKANQVGFDTVIRVFASSSNPVRAEQVIGNMFVAFNVFKDASANWFQGRRIIPLNLINTPWIKWNFMNRMFNVGEKTSILVPEELASMYHFPNSRYNVAPIIKWLQYKVLPPPVNLPREGILLGYNVYRGAKREVRFKMKDRQRHHYVIGQTGTGKSAFLSWIIRQDIKNGDGVCVIDPHGDLIEETLAYIPKERVRDVIHFNPADQERPMGLNLLEADTPDQQDMASSEATEIFIKIFGDEIFGPRIQHYFRNACLTLMEDKDEGATLIDVPRMFTDDEFMKYKVTKVTNPVVKSFWEHEYANTGDRERQEMIPYFSAKFGPFITNTIMRNTIGQTKSAFDFRKCMDEKKILLVNLSKGRLGALNTQLLGLVIVAKIQMAAMSRVDIPEDKRANFYLYVDEFQNFATDSFCSILSEARKYHLNLIMAHQYINQLVVTKNGSTSGQIKDAVFGNVGTVQSFKVGAEDAEYLAKEYSPVLTEQDIIGIANYKAYIKLNIDSSTSRPFSLETIYDNSGMNDKIREIVKQYSRMKHGRKRVFVDQEITSRIGIDIAGPGKDDKSFEQKLKDKGLLSDDKTAKPVPGAEKDIGKILNPPVPGVEVKTNTPTDGKSTK